MRDVKEKKYDTMSIFDEHNDADGTYRWVLREIACAYLLIYLCTRFSVFE